MRSLSPSKHTLVVVLIACLLRALFLGALVSTADCTTPSASGRPGASGCSGASESSSQAQHAQCLVCKSEGDLACVDVTVRGDTPRTKYLGRTYYFCREQCRKDFDKEPQRYIGQ